MNHTYNYIFGIDPGTNTGISIYQIDDEFNIHNLELHTIDLNKYITDENNSVSKDVDRYLALGELLESLLKIYNPKAIAFESSFINVRFKKSGMSVMGYIAILMYTIKKYDRNIYLCKFAPKLVKKFMGDSFADKDLMKTLIPKELYKFLDIEKETEHSIDALAIGYQLVQHLKLSPYLIHR